MTHYSFQEQNTTSLSLAFSASECIAWLTLIGMEAVVIVMLNAFTIIVYLKERSLRKCSMYLVINLGVADMFVAGSAILECWFLGLSCNIWSVNPVKWEVSLLMQFILWFFFTPSLINLGAISLERTHATFRPFKHRLIKKKIFGAAAAIVWITAGLLITSLVLTVLVFQPLNLEALRIFFTIYYSFFLFCHLIIVVSYSSVAIKIVCGTQPHHHGATSRERKLTKTLFIVTVVSLLLTLPNTIFMFCRRALLTLTMLSDRTYFWLYYSFLFLFYLNSLVNPVLYTFRMPEFRRALFSFLHCRSQL
ncbi:lysophosphatidic acid receptor 3-like [Acropora millepora]|uniref:lysophosphatidic acid receptor 3-like n=1 Tax=Acropora millepora TaxID=45264 RepID=UPI001CF58639|nr:lysophosphatidic acid receptor 3-like [Acropora millepora]